MQKEECEVEMKRGIAVTSDRKRSILVFKFSIKAFLLCRYEKSKLKKGNNKIFNYLIKYEIRVFLILLI